MKNMTFIPSKISGEVRIPSSKSQAHRALICAALAGNSTVCGIDSSNDIKATLGALRALGAEIAEDTRTRSFYIKKPCSHSANAGVINSGESASTLRFFIPLAAALGAGLKSSRPKGAMVVDIGGGTTDIAVIVNGTVIVSDSVKTAGDTFNRNIVRYVRDEYHLLIGEKTAERLK